MDAVETTRRVVSTEEPLVGGTETLLVAEKEDVADLRAKGLKGVLQKPFDFGALSRAVRQAIDS